MPINIVNTTKEEKDFKFVQNRTSILRTNSTNKVTFNHVNAIVRSPKVGDVMCVTRYTDENDSLLPADQQEVVWIDGLSINPKQLSQEYEPIGICVAINGNKAMVRYREERDIKFSAIERWEIPNLSIMNDGAEHTLQIKLANKAPKPFTFTAQSRLEFVNKLNAWFLANDTNYSVELVELNTDLPATDTSDDKDGDSYRNRIIVSLSSANSYINISINNQYININRFAICKPIKAVDYYYKNNGFVDSVAGCCYAKYYDYINANQYAPYSPMTSINSSPDPYAPFPWSSLPAKKDDFIDNEYCQILRDNFATYDEYVNSFMVKCPCGKGGVITEFPSGKENTYKLADCTYLDNKTGKQEILYPAANWVASIDLNASGLQAGNWWLPSAAEMVQMMRDITYETSFWNTKPDIVNRVLIKLNKFDSKNWSILSPFKNRWTSSMFYHDSDNADLYCYGREYGVLYISPVDTYLLSGQVYKIAPITIYEF